MKKLLIMGLAAMMLVTGCSSAQGTNAKQQAVVNNKATEAKYENKNYVKYVDTSDIKTNVKDLGGVWSKYYTKYLQYHAPNGKPITIVAQDKVTDEQMLRAYNVLAFYLSPKEGIDKVAVANSMADKGAVLVMPNGADGETKINDEALAGQTLYQNETPVTGSKWYMENDYSHRDAAMEEILHMTHDYGMGTKSNPGVLPKVQKEIYAATMSSLPKSKADWGKKGLWGLGSKDWLVELEKEGSLEQEYLASVIDSYFGLWGPYTESKGGMWGIYTSKLRSDVAKNDPKGYALAEKLFPKNYTSMERLDPSFKGTFKLYFDKNDAYTHKSQYLTNLRITGSNPTSVYGNDLDNTFMAGKGDATIDGGKGNDVLQLQGKSTDYKINRSDDVVTITSEGKEGKITLKNVETLRFTDLDKTL